MNIQRLWSVMQGYTDGLSTAEVLMMPPSIPKLLYYVGWLLKVVHTGWYTVSRKTHPPTAVQELLSPSCSKVPNGAQTPRTVCSVYTRSFSATSVYSLTKAECNTLCLSSEKKGWINKNAKVIATPSGPLVMIIWEIRILKSKYIHSCVYSVLQGQILHNSTLDFKS